MSSVLPPHTVVELAFGFRPQILGAPRVRVEMLNDPSGRIVRCFEAARKGVPPTIMDGLTLGGSPAEIEQSMKRLLNVQIEARPIANVIERMDRPKTLFIGDLHPDSVPDRDEARYVIELLGRIKGGAFIRCINEDWKYCVQAGFQMHVSVGDIATFGSRIDD